MIYTKNRVSQIYSENSRKCGLHSHKILHCKLATFLKLNFQLKNKDFSFGDVYAYSPVDGFLLFIV